MLQTMREDYYKAEGMERLKGAGNKVARRVPDDLVLGDVVVHYMEEIDKSVQPWKGPATVVAVERDVIIVRHGSAYYRRHPHRLWRWTLESGERQVTLQGRPLKERKRGR